MRLVFAHLVLLDRSPANHPTPSFHHTVWNFTSSMLMTVGDADTLWHHQVFHGVTFELQRLTEDSATAVPCDSLCHGDVGESGTSPARLSSVFVTPSAEKYVHIVLAIEAREGSITGNWPPSRGRDCSPSAEKYVHMVSAMEARECPNTHVQTQRLMAIRGRVFEDMMATHIPPGIAGESAGRSSNIQWVYGQLWRNHSVHLTGATSGAWTRGHSLVSSISSVPPLSSPSVSPQTVQRYPRALRSPSRPASVRTLKTKPDVPSIHLVLLKGSIAQHPSYSGPPDNPG